MKGDRPLILIGDTLDLCLNLDCQCGSDGRKQPDAGILDISGRRVGRNVWDYQLDRH